jgi:hypothetical protein
MTREEAKDIVFNYALGQKINDGINTLDEIIDQIFDYFGEQLQDKDDEIELLKCRIEEAMKPKTCEGCRYGAFGVNGLGFEVECRIGYNCSRGREDRYEPKDNA